MQRATALSVCLGNPSDWSRKHHRAKHRVGGVFDFKQHRTKATGVFAHHAVHETLCSADIYSLINHLSVADGLLWMAVFCRVYWHSNSHPAYGARHCVFLSTYRFVQLFLWHWKAEIQPVCITYWIDCHSDISIYFHSCFRYSRCGHHCFADLYSAFRLPVDHIPQTHELPFVSTDSKPRGFGMGENLN